MKLIEVNADAGHIDTVAGIAGKQEASATAIRESLYEEIEKSARLDVNYLALVMLSTVVAAIGLIEDNVAVVIGAMVIAPLLGPNLALALGTALGAGQYPLAVGAGLLLAVNVVCVNLAAKVVFFTRGIHPRTWWEKKKAKRALAIYIGIWVLSLAVLVAVIYARGGV
jgi:uncharacterized membrane protein